MKFAAALVIVTVGVLFRSCVEAFPHCQPCTDGNCDPPEDCLYGIKMDVCGRMVCAKGPGQRCGGKFNMFGMCGDGTFCYCNRCTGCSLVKHDCYTTSNAAKCV
ncbi:neuroparsin-A-like [Hetaerina americana]|uniref:neuroparsin-A-like n=1 Tax=Hetaerina americana TaxID=62018 RepID=UPI003A7F4602